MSTNIHSVEFTSLATVKQKSTFADSVVASYISGNIDDRVLQEKIYLAHCISSKEIRLRHIEALRFQIEQEIISVKQSGKENQMILNLLQLSSDDFLRQATKIDFNKTLEDVLKYFDSEEPWFVESAENKAYLEGRTITGLVLAPKKAYLVSSNKYGKNMTVTLKEGTDHKGNVVSFTIPLNEKADCYAVEQILKQKNSLTSLQCLHLMSIAQKHQSNIELPIKASPSVVSLALECKKFSNGEKAILAADGIVSNEEQFFADLITSIKNRTKKYLSKPRTPKGRRAAMQAIADYIDGVEKLDIQDANFENSLSILKTNLTTDLKGMFGKSRRWGAWLWSFYSSVPNNMASLVSLTHEQMAANIINEKIKVQEERERKSQMSRPEPGPENISESRNFLEELANLREINDHQKLSEIVTQQWNGITISKDDFLETMEKIKASIESETNLHDEKIEFTHYRPNEDVAEENDDDEEDEVKPIEDHFQSIITTAQVAAEANHAEDFSAQLQDVQRKLNFLLLHRHVAGQKVQTLISDNTQEQFDKKRKEFNTIISETKHAAVKEAVWVNVEALKKEIVRLKDFYSSARDELSSFHKQLSATKQNDFANEVEELILSKESETSCMGTRIDQLEAHLRMLEAFPNEKYDANHSSNNRQHQTTLEIMDELEANCKALTDSSATLIQAIQVKEGLTENKKLQAAIQTVKLFFVDNSGNVRDTEGFRKQGIISSESSENESNLTMNDSGRANGGANSFFQHHNSGHNKESSLVVGGGFKRSNSHKSA